MVLTSSLIRSESASSPSAQAEWPRITLVTAVYNGEKYLDETIRSIVQQGYPNLEYIIVNDGSTDGTAEIIEKYKGHLSGCITQPNRGMYAALNAGFAESTGEIMGWLNCSDMLHVGGLRVVGSVFRQLAEVEWVTGHPTSFEENGMTAYVERLKRWSRYRFLAGANKYIQQESTFWRRSLWEKAGGYVDASGRCGHVADFELWVRFFRHARLYTVDALIGGFRLHGASRGVQQVAECQRIQQAIVDAELDREDGPASLRALRAMHRAIGHIPKVRNWWNGYFIGGMQHAFYHWAAGDWPPVIEYDGDHWRFRR